MFEFNQEQLMSMVKNLSAKGDKYMDVYTKKVQHNTRAEMFKHFREAGCDEETIDKVKERVKDELTKNKNLSNSKKKSKHIDIRLEEKSVSK